VAAVAVVALLFLVVFPWLSPRLPFTDTTIEAFGAHGWDAVGGST
jgi:hypothetical protein